MHSTWYMQPMYTPVGVSCSGPVAGAASASARAACSSSTRFWGSMPCASAADSLDGHTVVTLGAWSPWVRGQSTVYVGGSSTVFHKTQLQVRREGTTCYASC
jgi:hypothetical protein